MAGTSAGSERERERQQRAARAEHERSRAGTHEDSSAQARCPPRSICQVASRLCMAWHVAQSWQVLSTWVYLPTRLRRAVGLLYLTRVVGLIT